MRYDFHVHTDASSCSGATPQDVVTAALNANLDAIAITDHDTQENVRVVQDTAPEALTVIPGVEVTTTQGHLLALDIETVPPREDPHSVVEFVHDAGGVAVLAHPFDRLRQVYTDHLTELADAADAIEVCNSRCLFERYNRRAAEFAAEHNMTTVAGSDAHFPHELGRACTVSETDPISAITTGDCIPHGRGRYVSGHIATKLRQFIQ